MVKYQYRIAEISIQVEAPFEIYDTQAFSLYRVDCGEQVDYTIRVEEDTELVSLGANGSLLYEDELNHIYWDEGKVVRFFSEPISQRVIAWSELEEKAEVVLHVLPIGKGYFQSSTGIFNASGMERILYQNGKYLFHCAYVGWKEKGILFSAPSGGGKTTQGLLWEKYSDGRMLNGDRAVLDQKEDGSYVCHGLPVAGSSGVFLNESYPLAVIFCVKKGPVNRAVRLNAMDAFKKVYGETTINLWNPQFRFDTVDFLMRLVTQVPVYELECRIDEEAVETAKAIVNQIEIEG